MKSLVTTIAEHPFFSDLPAEHFPLLAACARLQTFRAQEPIFRMDYDAGHFYLLLDGKVALETPYVPGEGVLEILTLGAGEVLGWSWLYPPYQWHFSARASEDTTAVVFDAEKLRELAETNTAIGYRLALRIGGLVLQRLQSTRGRLLDACEVGR